MSSAGAPEPYTPGDVLLTSPVQTLVIRRAAVIAAWMASALVAPPVVAQPDALQALIDQEIAEPDWRSAEREWESRQPAGRRSGSHGEPGEDAPFEALAGWWASREREQSVQPSETVRAQLFAGCQRNPRAALELLDQLPETDACHDWLHGLLVDGERGRRLKPHEVALLRTWLVRHSRHYRAELRAAAAAVKLGFGDIEGEADLAALARSDQAAALPILRRLAAGDEPRLRALALHHLVRLASARAPIAADDPTVVALRVIGADTKAPGVARWIVVTALGRAPLAGSESWLRDCLRDATLAELTDSYALPEEWTDKYRDWPRGTPLADVVTADPDRWTPVVARLAADADPWVRAHAVRCLVALLERRLEEPARHLTAVVPLLPWLNDPTWSAGDGRHWVINRAGEIQLPAAIPGLARVLETSKDDREINAAAHALARFGDSRAIPVLRRLVDEFPDFAWKVRFARELIACGEAPERSVAGIVAYARLAVAQGLDDHAFARSRPWCKGDVALGAAWAADDALPDAIEGGALAQAAALERDEPEVARRLVAIVDTHSDQRVLRRIALGTATADTLRAALRRRDVLRGRHGDALATLGSAGGERMGIATVLRREAGAIDAVLAGSDAAAQRAVLACARVARDPLPLERVSPLLRSPDRALAHAAVRYLEACDGPLARRLVLAHYPGQVRILGPSYGGPNYLVVLRSWEERLRAELASPDGPTEIFALLRHGHSYEAAPGHVVVRVRDGLATVRLHDGTEIRTRDGLGWGLPSHGPLYSWRELSASELAALRTLVADDEMDDLVSLDNVGELQYCYLHATRDGGRRVLMWRPGADGSAGSRHDALHRRLRGLVESGEMRARLDIEDLLEGVAVVVADPLLTVESVAGDGSEVRVLVINDGWPRHPSWRRVGPDGLGGATPPPPSAPDAERRDDVPDFLQGRHDRFPWQVRIDGGCLRAGSVPLGPRAQPGEPVQPRQPGLWRCRAGSLPEVVALGAWWEEPLVVPDSGWAVATACGPPDEGNRLERIALTSGARTPVDLAPATHLRAVAYVPSHRRVLVVRAGPPAGEDGVGPAQSEHYLLDVSTGGLEPVAGEFRPWLDVAYGIRPLQPTGKPDEVWAAIYQDHRAATLVGRYDTRRFAFTAEAVYLGLALSSMDVWVDDGARVVYAVVAGRLVRLPLGEPRWKR